MLPRRKKDRSTLSRLCPLYNVIGCLPCDLGDLSLGIPRFEGAIFHQYRSYLHAELLGDTNNRFLLCLFRIYIGSDTGPRPRFQHGFLAAPSALAAPSSRLNLLFCRWGGGWYILFYDLPLIERVPGYHLWRVYLKNPGIQTAPVQYRLLRDIIPARSGEYGPGLCRIWCPRERDIPFSLFFFRFCIEVFLSINSAFYWIKIIKEQPRLPREKGFRRIPIRDVEYGSLFHE